MLHGCMRLENSKNVEGNYIVYLNERNIQKHYFKICITVKKFGELQYTNLVVIKTYVYFYHFLLPHAQTPVSDSSLQTQNSAVC